jgi:hypothetical protein
MTQIKVMRIGTFVHMDRFNELQSHNTAVMETTTLRLHSNVCILL